MVVHTARHSHSYLGSVVVLAREKTYGFTNDVAARNSVKLVGMILQFDYGSSVKFLFLFSV